ncbi:MAG: hypothetical protein CMD83_10390 [Gammaproteobacteria bacterium]|nr:hypothetical protein [Gammaproteobacteria bacterium]
MADNPGIAAARAFVDAFNAQDHARLAGTLNYPHVRLANNQYRTVGSAEDFATGSRNGESRLRGEGWDHTVLESAEVVHEGDDKVHLALVMARYDKDGKVYNRFDTFWIATLENGKWGIRFRSSFLR